MQSKANIYSTLAAPEKAPNIPTNSKWLSGEGAGSWFYIEFTHGNYKTTRYSPEGKPECSGLFNITNKMDFDIAKPFEFFHISHCKSLTIKQENRIINMERIH